MNHVEGLFSRPCSQCRDGLHQECLSGACGCISPHGNDDPVMRGFKRVKRALHPEREAWTRGGWS